MLSLVNLSAGYGGAGVLHDVTLHVPDSSVVALIGANGAGKTTLLRAASGLLRPSRGSVILDGVDLTDAPATDHAAAGICYVPEGKGVFPSLTVRENLTFFAGRSAQAEVIDRVLNAFPRLGERLRQLAGTLSGGEQQMLALARAYVQQPKVVLLDEVSMGLAPKLVDEIFASLEQLAREGLSLLVVEQYVTKVMAIAGYACLLAQGRLAFVGEAPEVAGMDLAGAYLGSGASL
ncbi:MAG TPA: ABC transporter ATP-binding protein [Acidimicrobiia bacterium]|nr:ABC transporter ATP-binding protein [Acidimicrobiia bacterium]